MAQEPSPVTQQGDTDEIRARIEQTRAEMSQTIDAIQERLSPRHIVSEAKKTLKNRTLGGVKRLTGRGQAVVRDARAISWDTEDVAVLVRDNAVPIGAGLAVAAVAERALRGRAHRNATMWLLIGACAGIAFRSAIRMRWSDEEPYAGKEG